MLQVYICEDNLEEQKIITEIIRKLITIEDLNMQIAKVSAGPDEILSAIQTSHNVGIYFLDVDLKADIDGIALAEQIRLLDPRGFIVFITTHDELCPLTFEYKVEAMDYISKDDFKALSSRIGDCLRNALNRYLSSANTIHKVFRIKIGNHIFSLPMEDVYYFESASSPHKVIAHLKTGMKEFYETIDNLEESADGRFRRCHRSYLVNSDHIKYINYRQQSIHFTNGKSCPISARQMRILKKFKKKQK